MHSDLPSASSFRASARALLASLLIRVWRCTSWVEVALPSVSLLISEVAGCWPFWSPAVGAGRAPVGPEPASLTAICLERAAICCVHGPGDRHNLGQAFHVPSCRTTVRVRLLGATWGRGWRSVAGSTPGLTYPSVRCAIASVCLIKRLCRNVVAEDGEQAISHAWTPATWERRDHRRGGRAEALQRGRLLHALPRLRPAHRRPRLDGGGVGGLSRSLAPCR